MTDIMSERDFPHAETHAERLAEAQAKHPQFATYSAAERVAAVSEC